MRIINLPGEDTLMIEQTARLLMEGFAISAPTSWPDLGTASVEVEESLTEDHISLIALDDNNAILGWIAGIREYDGNVWEMHPLVVAPQHQGKGIGRILVQIFEQRVKELGGLTILLGTDDEKQQTTLSNVNLYSNIFEQIATIENLKRHPYEFYQKMGYTIVGVVPDANGLGKPDILMAKSLIR